jgi:general L-amino acid transport system substrate-binding protein
MEKARMYIAKTTRETSRTGRWLFAIAAALFAPLALGASTLDTVRERGQLHCAIHPGQAGMSYLDRRGEWNGFFVDYCRALAAATLGDPRKVKFLPTTSNKRFTVLQTGEVDVLSRTTTWTFARDTGLGLNFSGIMYYDGQSFLVRKAAGIRKPQELAGATICITKGTTAELNTADFFLRQGLSFRSLVFENVEEAKIAFFARRCDAMTTDALPLTIIRLSDAERPEDYEVLPELLSKEPFGPVVRSDDDQWFDINKWLLNALLAAEEFGITSENIDTLRQQSRNPEVKRLLGVQPGLGKPLGLDDAWAYRAIKAVGNYEQLFERHVAPLGVERGLNRLQQHGGLMYPLPFR